MPLDDRSRGAAQQVFAAVEDAVGRGFLPAAPREGACDWCDYRAVCGPYEELRVGKKKQADLADADRAAEAVVTRPARARAELDAPARERIRQSLDESLLVEAAAGTGKTTELVRRVVAVIADGRMTAERGGKGMGGLVAVTFTRKAAGELELRLRQELEEARRSAIAGGDPAAQRNVEDAIRHLEEAHIGTIHSFCAELLRERPVEARIDPAFESVSDEDGPRLFAQAFNGWIQETLAEMPEGLRRALVRLASKPPFGGLAAARSTDEGRARPVGVA